ncbi:MAG TPA: sigma-70 family RNA polymerase sigma factor [Mycobacteriales bacterium]|jgi:RNA polymerase sigma factor (sigma-70 family)
MAVPWPEIAAHRERLVRLARRRVPTLEDAEDVVSEAMLRCATFEGLDPARLAQFLTTVTLRLCADFYREAERGARLARRLDLDDVPSPEDLACAAADAGIVRDSLGRLPDTQRAVLVDRSFGLSVTQISHRHSLTYKAVESALSRARATMRTALAGALALVFGAAEAIRRRPALENAIPAATVAFVAAVVAPFGTPAPIGGEPLALAPAPPPAVIRAVRPAAPAPRPVPVPAPTPAPALARLAPLPPRLTAPRPEPSRSISVPLGDEEAGVKHNGSLVSQDDVSGCLRNGPKVQASLTPGEPMPSYHGNVYCPH